MATPSSSATTPSPRMPYLAASPAAPPAPSPSRESPASVKEERQRAIQKFFANAELSQLARGLRTRLSYASFKAINNITHTTLPDLEAQAQNQAPSSKTSANRSSASSSHTTAQGGSSANAQGSSARGLTRKGTMPPPPPVTASATQSLFSSLLQPPPSKRARTIHNPEDPPIPPPTKPKPTTPSRKSPAKASRASNSSGAASKPKSRKDAKGKKKDIASNEAGPSNRLITPQSTLGSEGFVENDDDMKAAATLTSLLLSRPSISGSAGSPRSSLSAASDAGSAHSFSHYAQSSTRTTAPAPVPTPLAHEGTFPGSFPRSKTPPAELRHARTQSLPHVSNYSMNGNTTPKAQARPGSRLASSNTPHAPTDTEAADLMLFLATSPSPARASSSKDKDSRDMAAFRTLGGQSALKGRVLFPASSSSTHEENTGTGPRPLRRDPTGSFSSTLSVATELIDDPTDGAHEHLIGIPLSSSPLNPHAIKRSRSDSTGHLDVPAPPTIIPPTPTDDQPTPLLPPPSSPGRTPRPRAVSENAMVERATSLPLSEGKAGTYAPPTPGNVPFNLNEYINVSPSPATQPSSGKLGSLRANVGRKLFEEHHSVPGGVGDREGLAGHGSPGSLGAGIDLVKSSV